MRAAGILAFIVFGVWVLLMVRFSCTELNFAVCESLCDAKGRELASVQVGFITKCNCGKRKLDRSMGKP